MPLERTPPPGPAQGGSSTSTARIINFVAGRLPLLAKRPTRPEIHVSQGHIAKLPPQPLEGVRSSEPDVDKDPPNVLHGKGFPAELNITVVTTVAPQVLSPLGAVPSRGARLHQSDLHSFPARSVVKVETDVPARWRKPPETANPSTLDKCASPRLYEKLQGATPIGQAPCQSSLSERSLTK